MKVLHGLLQELSARSMHLERHAHDLRGPFRDGLPAPPTSTHCCFLRLSNIAIVSPMRWSAHAGKIMANASRRWSIQSSVVQAFVDTKLERADISMALYVVATGREETALVKKVGRRAQGELASMLADSRRRCAPEVRSLRKQLVLLCRGFPTSAAA